MLVPWGVVEVKHGRTAQPAESALPVLVRSRDRLGTVDYYAVAGSRWYRADAGPRTLTAVDGAGVSALSGYGQLDDVNLATAPLTDRLLRWADQQQRQGRPEVDVFYSSVPLELGPFHTVA
jgi:hypothetical protein